MAWPASHNLHQLQFQCQYKEIASANNHKLLDAQGLCASLCVCIDCLQAKPPLKKDREMAS